MPKEFKISVELQKWLVAEHEICIIHGTNHYLRCHGMGNCYTVKKVGLEMLAAAQRVTTYFNSRISF